MPLHLKEKIKVIIADDHPVFRSGLHTALKTFSYVGDVSQAASGDEVIKLLETDHYHVVLMDIRMGRLSGIDATEIISKRFPRVNVIILSMHDDQATVIRALEKGAKGYLLKNADRNEIDEAIKDVIEGRQYFSKDVSRILFENIQELKDRQNKARNNPLSKERFRAIIFLIYHEFTTQEMAELLFLSSRTIDDYRKQILELTKSKNSIGITKYAITEGIDKDEQLISQFRHVLEKRLRT